MSFHRNQNFLIGGHWDKDLNVGICRISEPLEISGAVRWHIQRFGMKGFCDTNRVRESGSEVRWISIYKPDSSLLA